MGGLDKCTCPEGPMSACLPCSRPSHPSAPAHPRLPACSKLSNVVRKKERALAEAQASLSTLRQSLASLQREALRKVRDSTG